MVELGRRRATGTWRELGVAFAVAMAGSLAVIAVERVTHAFALDTVLLALAMVGGLTALAVPTWRGLLGALAGGWLVLEGAVVVASIVAPGDPETTADALLGFFLFAALVPVAMAPGFGVGWLVRRMTGPWVSYAPRWRDRPRSSGPGTADSG